MTLKIPQKAADYVDSFLKQSQEYMQKSNLYVANQYLDMYTVAKRALELAAEEYEKGGVDQVTDEKQLRLIATVNVLKESVQTIASVLAENPALSGNGLSKVVEIEQYLDELINLEETGLFKDKESNNEEA